MTARPTAKYDGRHRSAKVRPPRAHTVPSPHPRRRDVQVAPRSRPQPREPDPPSPTIARSPRAGGLPVRRDGAQRMTDLTGSRVATAERNEPAAPAREPAPRVSRFFAILAVIAVAACGLRVAY